jgi:NADPH-dependent 2,4-dienoyl-CoA reductase/sulfur reductase-like enzyme
LHAGGSYAHASRRSLIGRSPTGDERKLPPPPTVDSASADRSDRRDKAKIKLRYLRSVAGGIRHVVVVGGGLGGLRSVEALRREGFSGRITLVGDEPEPPYDRPPLSKDVLVGVRAPETTYFRSLERLAELGIDLMLDQPASRLDLKERRLQIGTTSLRFDGLILATGASPRTLPGLEGRKGVFTLRTLGDAVRLKKAFEGAQHVTIVGAGFIGAEVASSARILGLDVTIVELETTPLARVVGAEMGRALMRLHHDNGTELRLGVTIADAEADSVERLRLSDGTTLETDLVVVGIGVSPNVAWLDGSGLNVSQGIVCNAALNAGAPLVFAAGDAASWPNELFERRMRVEHWTNTAQQAAHAARNLLHETAKPFVGSNYVWSDQYGVRIQIVGSTLADHCAVVAGSVAEQEFVVWYRERDRLVGALGIGCPGLVTKSRTLIEQRSSWFDALAALDEEVAAI